MQRQESAENYLETILLLQKRLGSVRSIDVATEMGFSKPSVSVAMKNLRAKGQIDVDEHGCLVLTPQGRELAQNIYERHRLLTQLLQSMGVSQEVAAEDACRIEHDISDETFLCIKEYMAQKQ